MCHVSWIIKCHNQTWDREIGYSLSFLPALSDVAGRNVRCLWCTWRELLGIWKEGGMIKPSISQNSSTVFLYWWYFLTGYLSIYINYSDIFRLLDLKYQDILFHLMRTRDCFMSKHGIYSICLIELMSGFYVKSSGCLLTFRRKHKSSIIYLYCIKKPQPIFDVFSMQLFEVSNSIAGEAWSKVPLLWSLRLLTCDLKQ